MSVQNSHRNQTPQLGKQGCEKRVGVGMAEELKLLAEPQMRGKQLQYRKKEGDLELRHFTRCKIYFNSMDISGGQAQGQLPPGTGAQTRHNRFQLLSTSGYLPSTIGQVLEPAEEPGD